MTCSRSQARSGIPRPGSPAGGTRSLLPPPLPFPTSGPGVAGVGENRDLSTRLWFNTDAAQQPLASCLMACTGPRLAHPLQGSPAGCRWRGGAVFTAHPQYYWQTLQTRWQAVLAALLTPRPCRVWGSHCQSRFLATSLLITFSLCFAGFPSLYL